MPRRSPKKPDSNPPSSSVDVSGRRSTCPGFSGTTPGVPANTDRALNVVNLSNAPGAFPACPMALRSLRLLTHVGNTPYSEGIHEMSALGNCLNQRFSTNAELSSTRRQTVANDFSRYENRFCTWKPMLMRSENPSAPVVVDAAVTVETPGPAN